MKFYKNIEDEDGNIVERVELEVRSDIQAVALIADEWKEVKEPKKKKEDK